MVGYPLVVLTKSNNISSADQTPWMTPDAEEAFVAYVRQGGGLLGLHSGTAGYTQTPRLRQLLGGVFVQHPPQCPVTLQLHEGHALCAGAHPMTLQDEHYHMDMDASAAPVDVFMTTTSEHGSQPGGWTRHEGTGRVAVLTPGHNLEVWLHPSYRALLVNAMRWCANE
jgi:type 1 glutamine amidotransferase